MKTVIAVFDRLSNLVLFLGRSKAHKTASSWCCAWHTMTLVLPIQEVLVNFLGVLSRARVANRALLNFVLAKEWSLRFDVARSSRVTTLTATIFTPLPHFKVLSASRLKLAPEGLILDPEEFQHFASPENLVACDLVAEAFQILDETHDLLVVLLLDGPACVHGQ